MKTSKKLCMAGLLLASLVSSAYATTLNVPLRVQEHSQWCWAGASQMILNYHGKNPTQCAEVNYALGINYACGNTSFNWNNYANQPNTTNALSRILNRWGVRAGVTGVLSQSYSNWYLDNNHPYSILWQWRGGGGGHFVVATGYSGNYLYLNDPWPGNGRYVRTFASTVSASDRWWYNTAVTY